MNHELHHLDQTEEGETSPELAEIPVDNKLHLTLVAQHAVT